MLATETRAFHIAPFHVEHYLALWNDIYAWVTIDGAPDKERVARTYQTGGPAWTAMTPEGPIAAGGVVIPWKGLGHAWAAVSPRAREIAPLGLTRAVRGRLEDIMRTHSLRRVQATVFEGHERSRRWVEALGFRWESDMPKYGPKGETGHVYVRLPSW